MKASYGLLFALVLATYSLPADAQYLGTLQIPYWRANQGAECAAPITVARQYEPAFPYTYVGIADCRIGHGSGPTMEFQSRNLAGVWRAGVALNCGLIDATPGNENGDCDFRIMVDGAYGPVIALTGKWAGQRPGILPWPNDLFWLGSDGNQWGGIWATIVPCPITAPARECIRVSGGYAPIYR